MPAVPWAATGRMAARGSAALAGSPVTDELAGLLCFTLFAYNLSRGSPVTSKAP